MILRRVMYYTNVPPGAYNQNGQEPDVGFDNAFANLKTKNFCFDENFDSKILIFCGKFSVFLVRSYCQIIEKNMD